MKIELHFNSHISITLEPEGIIEQTIIDEMVSRAERGVAVQLKGLPIPGGIKGMEVRVEK